MRSFGLIEKLECEHHRVPASEKPHELMMKFYSLARSCTQGLLHSTPHTALVAARNAPVWARLQCIGTVVHPAKYRPKFPAFRGFFCTKTGFT